MSGSGGARAARRRRRAQRCLGDLERVERERRDGASYGVTTPCASQSPGPTRRVPPAIGTGARRRDAARRA